MFKNPLHAALSLILIFVNMGILLIFLDLEFLGLIFIMVYVGAIMVMLIFSIISFNFKNINFKIKKNSNNYYNFKLQYFLLLNFLLNCYLSNILYNFLVKISFFSSILKKNYFYILNNNLNSIDVFGLYLYTQYYLYFFLIGFVLLIALIGIILILLDKNPFKLQQNFKVRAISSINNLH